MKRKLLVILAILITAFLLIWKLNFLSVNNVKIISNADCVDSEKLKKEINLLGQNLIFLETSGIEKKIKNKYLCVRSIEINYEFPKTIVINIFSRIFLSKIISFSAPLQTVNPEASVSSQTALLNLTFPISSNEASMIVDDTGYIFKQSEGEHLPLIYIDTKITLGEQLNQEIFQKISIIFKTLTNKISGLEMKSSRLKISEDYIIMDGNFIVIFDIKRDILKQLASLQLILQEAKINQGTLKSIDLRFDKAIVTYQTK